ncbi:hypothetical protein B0T18DRAFT_416690 [Schizothecium vesticola]|uniref:Uncharacterized protein n=1 Tax=Schizothecium vesticola TaxID=314040 RepID=A0AA40K3C3_9PEZI|nr:hypothetical protein B0T18DRAFT_416690 [Schizothecium vesticola]
MHHRNIGSPLHHSTHVAALYHRTSSPSCRVADFKHHGGGGRLCHPRQCNKE